MAQRTHQSSSSTFSGISKLNISKVVFTDVKLGRGADANVYEVDWHGTVCAAKILHEALLEDQSAGGVPKLISNFMAECLTWSKLRHPGVVQFFGVHWTDHISRGPILVMEKMDTSLRTYLDEHSKEEFPLHQKAFVLRQVTQAMLYLHSQNPPLVHHDLSPNNVLLNVVSCVTKVSDFGLSRAINPSALTRKSSIKGTQAFMPPEALRNPPCYNEKLDVFSFGNIVISTLTHEWPNPDPSTQYRGQQLVALNEFERRGLYVVKFTAQEKQLFQSVVRQCLENKEDKRPPSETLVEELKHIESMFLSRGHVAAPTQHLRQQLSAKEEECRQKNEGIKKKDEVIKEKDEVIKEKDEMIKGKDEVLKEKDEVIKKKDEALKAKDIVITTMQAEMEQLRRQNSEMYKQLTSKKAVREIEALKTGIQQLRVQPAASQRVS